MNLDFPLRTGLWNAAGTLGFEPNPRSMQFLGELDVFVTNPISLQPRTPAEARCVQDYPGVFLLHSGLPNPGLRRVLRESAPRWATSPLPVVVHLLGDPDEVAQMVRLLEPVEGVWGIELGLPPHCSRDLAAQLVHAAAGELPTLVSILPEQVEELAPTLTRAGVTTLSLSAPRGTLPTRDNRLVSGRVYGPAVLPLALERVQLAHQLGFTVIGSGGVYRRADVQAMHQAGAAAVQLDAVLWRGWEGEPQ